MPLSWNEIKGRAVAFAKEWAGETSERAEAQSFWNDFFGIFGLDRKRVAAFERQVSIARASGKLKAGRIDAFWKGALLIEHKSAGQKLDRAFAQAVDYFISTNSSPPSPTSTARCSRNTCRWPPSTPACASACSMPARSTGAPSAPRSSALCSRAS